MKKTVTVNLNGRVFTMDEDAYQLLDKYLKNLRIYFRKEEGASEIVADFEARIEELFSEKIRSGYEVITIEQVDSVITRVGRPGDFADKDEEEEKSQPNRQEDKEAKKKFFRNIDDKMFGGVCSGIAAYFGWNVVAVRIIFVILIFGTYLWVIPCYLLAWIIFPAAYTVEQKLQMQGKPITVENIGKTVASEISETPHPVENRGCLSGFLDIIVVLMKVFLVFLGFIIGVPILFALFIVVIVLFAVLFGVGGGLLGVLPFSLANDIPFLTVSHPVLAMTTFILVLGIPIVALIYTLIAYIAKLRPVHRAVKWIFLLLWVIALVVFLFSGIRFTAENFHGHNRTFNWRINSDHLLVEGNGNFSEREYVINDSINSVKLDDALVAHLQIEQSKSDSSSLLISGDENLIGYVKYSVNDGMLNLSTRHRLRSDNDLVIRLRTPDLKAIKLESPGKITIDKAFSGNELKIRLEGAGSFHADSLDIGYLDIVSEGIGSVKMSGKARKARLNVEGTGSIDALDLLSDSVIANVEGVGSVKCNPKEYLEGHLSGIGKITYKEEPKIRNVSSIGVAKIGKE
jgi:phage shock protein PspC (stress-responsive transcriptional regulator)